MIHRQRLCLLTLLVVAGTAIAETTLAISTLAELQAAAAGTGSFANLPPDATIVLQPGDYRHPRDDKPLCTIAKGGSEGKPRVFTAVDQGAVRLIGRINVTADHVILRHLTFDLRPYEPKPDKSFSTIWLVGASRVKLDGVICLGDGTKGRRGAHLHISADNAGRQPENIEVRNCRFLGFGRHGEADGKKDHGIYVSNVNKLLIADCEVAHNAGRGIQLFAHEAEPDRIIYVTLRHNRIHHNGRFPYGDGMVITGQGRQPKAVVRQVHVDRNLFWLNAFAGIRLSQTRAEGINATGNHLILNGLYDHRATEIFADDGTESSQLKASTNVFFPRHGVVGGFVEPTDWDLDDNLIPPEYRRGLPAYVSRRRNRFVQAQIETAGNNAWPRPSETALDTYGWTPSADTPPPAPWPLPPDAHRFEPLPPSEQ